MSTPRRPVVGARSPTLGRAACSSPQLRDALAAGEVDVAVHSYKDLPTAPDPRLVHRRHPAAGRPPRRAGRPRRPGAGRAARRIHGRHGIARGASPSSRPSASASTSSRSGATSTPACARSRRVSSTRWSSPRPGCGGWAASTRRPSCSTPLQMLPAPAQGALASSAAPTITTSQRSSPQVLDDEYTRAAVTAERAVLAALEAGCSAPMGRWPMWCPT